MAGNEGIRESWSQPVTFREWQRVLSESGLLDGAKRRHEREIVRFLSHCRSLRTPASIILAQSYIDDLEKQGDTNAARVSLRWFFREAPAEGRGVQGRDGIVPGIALERLARNRSKTEYSGVQSRPCPHGWTRAIPIGNVS
jgi:hypothetical protein